jgi:ubiquinone/menaquinone biosynthesis C-methylase UbiE
MTNNISGAYGSNTTSAVPYGRMNKMFATRTPQQFCTHLLPHLKPDFHILDIGCGPGSITIGLAQLVPHGQVIGIDVNQISLEIARQAATEAQVDNIEFVHGDAVNLVQILEGRGQMFDAIHMHMALMYFADPVKRLQEMRQYLRPGGVVATRDSCDLRMWPDDDWFQKKRATFKKMVVSKGGSDQAGYCTHEWFRQAGWPLEKLDYGAAAFEWHTPEERAMVAAGGKDFRKTSLDGGFETEEESDDGHAMWDAFEKNDAARIFGLDGWVVAFS